MRQENFKCKVKIAAHQSKAKKSKYYDVRNMNKPLLKPYITKFLISVWSTGHSYAIIL